MYFQVRARIHPERLAEFGARLSSGSLDRSAIRSETYCLAEDPSVGFSIWEAPDRNGFERVFEAWKRYYAETAIREVITPAEAMRRLSV